MGYTTFRLGFIVAACVVCVCGVARADTRLSVYAGPDFFTDQSAQGLVSGAVGTDIALGYELGPSGSSKVRYRADLDDSFVANANARLGYASIGASARLASPFYVGAGLTLDRVTIRQRIFYVYPGFGAPGDEVSEPDSATTTITSVAPDFFIGQKLFSSRGVGLSIEASYKLVPSVSYVNVDGVRVGLRANF